MMELDNLTKLNELWSVLPNSVVGETSSMEAVSLHSTRRGHRERRNRKEQDSQSASTVALAGSMLSETQDPSYRDGVNFEVEVEIETQPRAAHEQSLGSVISVQSFSGESLVCSREQLCLSSDATSKGTAAETHSMV